MKCVAEDVYELLDSKLYMYTPEELWASATGIIRRRKNQKKINTHQFIVNSTIYWNTD